MYLKCMIFALFTSEMRRRSSSCFQSSGIAHMSSTGNVTGGRTDTQSIDILTYLSIFSPFLPNLMRSQFLLLLEPSEGYFLRISFRPSTASSHSLIMPFKFSASSRASPYFCAARSCNFLITIPKLLRNPSTPEYAPHALFQQSQVFLIKTLKATRSLVENPKEAIVLH